MSSEWTVVILLILLGFGIALGGLLLDESNAFDALRTECELTLPRTQQCILIAVPEEE